MVSSHRPKPDCRQLGTERKPVPKEEERKTRDVPEENREIDRDIHDVIQEERRKGKPRGPKDFTEERKKRKLAQDLLKAIKAKDARIFTELLRQAGIREGSPGWKNAWKAFYSP